MCTYAAKRPTRKKSTTAKYSSATTSTANRTALARKAPARAMGTIANELKRESAPMCTRPNHVLTASIGPLWKRNKSMAEAIAPNVSCPSATGNMTPSERNQFRIDQAMVMSKTAIKKTSAAIPGEGFFSEDTLPARNLQSLEREQSRLTGSK